METIRKGSRGESVKKLQQILKINVDGIFGTNTETAVKQFQLKNGLVADGIVGSKTWDKLLNMSNSNSNIIIPNKPKIENYFLKPGQYLTGNYKNEYIILHHTAGGPDAKQVVNTWNTDSQGRVATEFIISGINSSTGNNINDGQIIKTFPDGCQAYHIGNSGSSTMNIHSVGVEICSMGNLTFNNGVYKTYVNSICQPNQVVKLNKPFRGYTYYHKYSDKQLESLRQLLLFIANRDNIDLHEGLYKWIKTEGVNKAFEFHEDAYYGKVKGMLSHCSIRKDKFDVSPQQNLVDMILSL